PVLGIHVSRRHSLQSRLLESLEFPAEGRQQQGWDRRRRCLCAWMPALDAGAGNLGNDGAVSIEGDCTTLLRIPHAWPRLCESRRPPYGVGAWLRLRRGTRADGGCFGAYDRRVLCDLGGNGEGTGRLRRLLPERTRHASRHAQPSPCGLWPDKWL